jgi:hypothetical protein
MIAAFLVPDVVKTIVDVPQFQPANVGWELGDWSKKFGNPGYGTRMVAYLDGDGGTKGSFDDGNVRRGRPTTYIEPHRKFRVGVSVPPDLRILVEESTIDLGKAPHGMGIDLTPQFLASNATGDRVQRDARRKPCRRAVVQADLRSRTSATSTCTT